MPSPESLRLTVTWLPLPNGLSADGIDLLFSVFVAFALTGDDAGGPPTLEDYPDLLAWPDVMPRLDLAVEMDGGTPVPARLLDKPRSTALWRALFTPATTVVPFAGEDLTQRPVMTFSSSEVFETVRDSYARMVLESAGHDLPLIAPLAQAEAGTTRPFAEFAHAMQHPVLASLLGGATLRGETLRGLVARAQARAGSPTGMVELMPGGQGPTGEVVRAVTFHTAQQSATEPITDPAQLAADRAALHDSIDFHKILSSVGEHPALLRRLGLVLDLAVTRSAVGARRAGAVRVVPTWTATFPDAASRQVDRTLWIAWHLDPDAPRPFSAAGDPVPGVLDLGTDGPFTVQPMALDSAVLQTMAMVQSLPEGGAPGAPPAVRSGGLTITHADRAQAVHADLTAATQQGRGASPSAALRAPDVVRGYRFDVLDDSPVDGAESAWRSLHARRVTYSKDDAPLLEEVQDEGAHHPSATGPPIAAGADPERTAPLYVPESFVRWDGWSLAAPRPGRSLAVDPTGPDPAHPATMPQRTVNDPLTQTGLRIETRPQPRTLPRLRFGHGYRLRARTVDLAGNGLDLDAADALFRRPSITLANGRVVSPQSLAGPVVAFSRFEAVPPPVIVRADERRESVRRLVLRSGTDDPAAAVADAQCLLFAPMGTVELAERHGMFDEAIGSADLARVGRGYDVAARENVALPAAGSAELPYLPDPLAIGVRIADAPGIGAGTTLAVSWRGVTWDRPGPITVRLLAGDDFQPPDPDEDHQRVTITLQPGLRMTLRISSQIPDGTRFGVLDWAFDRLNRTLAPDKARTEQARIRRVVDDSRHVMFTPWETLEIVHAVQRPTAAPDLQAQPDVERAPGETVYRPNATLVPEPQSTSVLQLDASWTDAVDDPAVRFERPPDGASMPWLRPVSTEVGTVPLTAPGLVNGVPPVIEPTDLYSLPGSTMPPLQFSDTRARRITLTATAVSRFADEFPELADRPGSFARTGAPAQAVVQSTARPPAPVVEDVVPIVSTGGVSLDRGTLVREGGWVRIWLQRPWFVTGAEEQLGVVIPRENPFGPGSPLYDHVSVLGRDGVYESPLSFGLRIEHVTEPVAVESVILHEPFVTAGVQAPVDLALFTPEFDFTSQRWFVDVRLAHEPYFPMARLAVVRFQPHSVTAGPGLTPRHYHVSPVALLDPVPLFPDRRLVVQKVIKPSHSLLRFELSGRAYTGTSSLDGTPDRTKSALARVTVRTQTRTPIELAGGGEHWLNGPAVDLKRESPDKPWRLQLEDDALREFLGDAEQVLVLEEDRLPADASEASPATSATRSVFAAVVEGPFVPS
jgi:hypothetical protein